MARPLVSAMGSYSHADESVRQNAIQSALCARSDLILQFGSWPRGYSRNSSASFVERLLRE